jgi:hypothetical protein
VAKATRELAFYQAIGKRVGIFDWLHKQQSRPVWVQTPERFRLLRKKLRDTDPASVNLSSLGEVFVVADAIKTCYGEVPVLCMFAECHREIDGVNGHTCARSLQNASKYEVAMHSHGDVAAFGVALATLADVKRAGNREFVPLELLKT